MTGTAIAQGIAAVAPIIPSLVTLAEKIFGHSQDTGKPPQGDNKMTSVTTAAMAFLTALANAGLIPSAAVVDASLPAALIGAVQQEVTSQKAQGLLGPLNGTANVGAQQQQVSGALDLSKFVGTYACSTYSIKLQAGQSATVSA